MLGSVGERDIVGCTDKVGHADGEGVDKEGTVDGLYVEVGRTDG